MGKVSVHVVLCFVQGKSRLNGKNRLNRKFFAIYRLPIYCKGRNYWVVLNLGDLGYCSFLMVTGLVTMATANETTVAMVPPCRTDESPKLSTTQYFYPYSN